MRYFWTVLLLLCVVAWLVISYWPAAAAALPTISFGPAWVANGWMPAAAVALGLCLLIQGWLVYATVRVLRRPQATHLVSALEQFQLRVGVEAFWTALPILMTLAVGGVIFAGVFFAGVR